MSAPNPPQSERPRRRRVRNVLLGIAALVALGGVAAVYTFGPLFGVWLIPPSPQRYAQIALDMMGAGVYANTPEWERTRQETLDAARDARSIPDTYEALKRAAKVAGGKHSSFRTPEEARTNDRDSTTEFAAPTVTTRDGVTTITVPELGGVSAELLQRYADTAARGIEAAAPQTCGWIVDARGNRGGNMYPMLAGLAPLLPDGEAMSFETVKGARTPVVIKDGGVAVGAGPAQVPTPVRLKATGQNVAVLQDELTASSGEAVLTAFRGLPNARSFGQPSAGYSSANQVMGLYDGARLVLTTAAYVDRAGTSLKEAPMTPDDEVPAATADAAASTWLKQGSCRAR